MCAQGRKGAAGLVQVGSPGWGYAVSKAARHAVTMQTHPLSDGLWVSDVATGKGRLVVSLAHLREVTMTGVCAHGGKLAQHFGSEWNAVRAISG
jgi:hypothetical protein